MDLKHSPGPWKLQAWEALDQDGAIEACGSQVVDANGCMIAACTIEGSTEMEEADARLIAAAPDLLEALKLIAAEAAEGAGSIGPAGWMGAIARVAIAKATGSVA